MLKLLFTFCIIGLITVPGIYFLKFLFFKLFFDNVLNFQINSGKDLNNF